MKAIWLVILGWLLAAAPLAGAAGQAQDVGSLGHIEPQGGVMRLMGGQGDTVAKVLVREGQTVKRGEPLAQFASLPLMEVELAQARLAQREAQELGGSQVLLQDNRIKSAEAELELAQKTYDNLGRIGKEAFSALQIEQRKSQIKLARLLLDSAKLERERLTRQNDIALEQARQRVKAAQERLDQATLRAPSDGTVLEINKRVGEVCGGEPFILLADLSVMYVVADVFEADLPQLKPGQEASITGKALGKTLKGKVEEIGRLVQVKSKEAKVRIRLDDAGQASRLINSEVNVSIQAAP